MIPMLSNLDELKQVTALIDEVKRDLDSETSSTIRPSK